ncbi:MULTISPECIES: hypothetical protein [unclassified Streptomyces]|nr:MULTISPECIES: hypothetical protein [unclassified Streptomyces]MCX5334213.1 hypothetical protein [Streptomyces sp. NBC_00140]MCX5363715.1 hypothetical protein [Streptomyces sp. NBC_00124]
MVLAYGYQVEGQLTLLLPMVAAEAVSGREPTLPMGVPRVP